MDQSGYLWVYCHGFKHIVINLCMWNKAACKIYGSHKMCQFKLSAQAVEQGEAYTPKIQHVSIPLHSPFNVCLDCPSSRLDVMALLVDCIFQASYCKMCV